MTDHIRITPSARVWVIRAGGIEIGRSAQAMELFEGGRGPTIYVPRADMDMARLTRTARSSTCPWKGQASYYSVVTEAGTLADAVWSYETPKADCAAIAGHLAFYTDRITVTPA